MVKGNQRQVILVHSPDPRLFEQAIFILRDDHKPVTDEMLLKEAERIIGTGRWERRRNRATMAAVWILTGAFSTALVWLLSVLA